MIEGAEIDFLLERKCLATLAGKGENGGDESQAS